MRKQQENKLWTNLEKQGKNNNQLVLEYWMSDAGTRAVRKESTQTAGKAINSTLPIKAISR